MARLKQWFEWTVRVRVHRTWVADGFDLDNEGAKEMVAKRLPGAYNTEIGARVLTRPDRKEIRKAQGYEPKKRRRK